MEFKFSDNEAITHLDDLATIWGLILCQVHTKEGVEVICVYMLYSWILNAREAVSLTDLVYKHEEGI